MIKISLKNSWVHVTTSKHCQRNSSFTRLFPAPVAAPVADMYWLFWFERAKNVDRKHHPMSHMSEQDLNHSSRKEFPRLFLPQSFRFCYSHGYQNILQISSNLLLGPKYNMTFLWAMSFAWSHFFLLITNQICL